MPENQQIQQQTIVPTLIIGVGGTGVEVITRIRRLVVESYGSLDQLPVVAFLHIDTDQKYKIKKQEMAGPSLEDYEKLWVNVSYDEANKIKSNPKSYSWYHDWLPPELTPDKLVSEEGAGQIRACGRFALIYNHTRIREKCEEARTRIAVGQDQLFIDDDVLTVEPKLNVFVVGSIAGGTGSGMLIDLGYSLRHWFQGERLDLTAIIPTPDAFSGIGGNVTTQENGYAALMELNYFSDANTIYSQKYGLAEGTRITDKRPPYDCLYLTGTRNQAVTLRLDTVQEMMAQQVFLDLVSDYSPYKRSVRDNVKRAAGNSVDQVKNAKQQPISRSYPLNFFSFGIATIEIPVHAIRKALAARLTADLYNWWLNANVQLPSDLQQEAEGELKELKLSSKELLSEILLNPDGVRYETVVQKWIKEVEQEIITEQRLESTAQLPNPMAKETGKILGFVDSYLQPKVDDYQQDHFRDDQRRTGDFIQRMEDNATQLKNNTKLVFQEKIYTYLEDTQKGSRAIKAILEEMRKSLEAQIEKLEREAQKTWEVLEEAAFGDYNAACSQIDEFRNRWIATKENWMKKQCDQALTALGKSLKAKLQHHSRLIAARVQRHFLTLLEEWEKELDRWSLRIQGSESKYQDIRTQQENYIEQLEIVGSKLFERQELQFLYHDFLQVSGGKDALFKQLTQKVKDRSRQSKFWSQSASSALDFRLLDVAKIDDLKYPQFEDVVAAVTNRAIKEAPTHSKLYTEMDACTRFVRLYPDRQQQDREIQRLFNKSKPLVRLDGTIAQEGGFKPIEFHQAGIIGGENTTETAASQVVTLLKKYFTQQNAIAPLSNRERHKILATHEIGVFSLRSIAGSENLRSAYQKWRGERVQAERAILKGLKQENELPSPVHIQKDMVFWDFHLSDPAIEQLVLVAHALEILFLHVNQTTKKDMICYRSSTRLDDEEKVAVAANWDDTIQVLELPDCREDKEAIERQLNQQLDEDREQTQGKLGQKLQGFLAQKLESEFRGNQEDPSYLRMRTIILEFMDTHQLDILSDPSSVSTDSPTKPQLGFVPPSDNPPTDSLGGLRPNFCTNCRNPLSLSDKFCSECGHRVGT